MIDCCGFCRQISGLTRKVLAKPSGFVQFNCVQKYCQNKRTRPIKRCKRGKFLGSSFPGSKVYSAIGMEGFNTSLRLQYNNLRTEVFGFAIDLVKVLVFHLFTALRVLVQIPPRIRQIVLAVFFVALSLSCLSLFNENNIIFQEQQGLECLPSLGAACNLIAVPLRTTVVRSQDLERLKKGRVAGDSLRKIAKSSVGSKSSLHRQSSKLKIASKQLALLLADFGATDEQATEIAMFLYSPSGRIFLQAVQVEALLNLVIPGLIGCNELAIFFNKSGLAVGVASSSRSLRKTADNLRTLSIEYQSQEVNHLENLNDCAKRHIALIVDETWNAGKMILVAIDAITGFTIAEVESKKRTTEAWLLALGKKIHQSKDTVINSIVSDEASALRSLGHELNVARFPDLFHIDQEISKCLSRELGRRVKSHRSSLEAATEEVRLLEQKKEEYSNLQVKLVGRPPNWSNLIAVAKHAEHVAIKELTREENRVKNLSKIKLEMNNYYNPINLRTGALRSGGQIVANMKNQIKKIEKIGMEASIDPSRLKKHLGKAQRAINRIEKAMNMIKSTAVQSLEEKEMTSRQKKVLWNYLVPALYYSRLSKMSRTTAEDCKKLETKFKKYLTQAEKYFDTDSYSAAYDIATTYINSFQRSSSPLEGLNGQIARGYLARRGYSVKAQSAARVIRDYYQEDSTGRTAAELYYGQKPRLLRSYLAKKLPPLPEPRSIKIAS